MAGVFVAVVAAAAAPAAGAATAPPGYVIARSAPFVARVSLLSSPGQERCPAGTVTWGGGTGYLGTPGPGEAIGGSVPVGTGGWEVQMDNSTNQPADFRVDVICAKKPTRYVEVTKMVANPAGAVTNATVGCPKNTVILGGGERTTSESRDARIVGSFPIGQTKFRGVVYNGSGAGANLEVDGVCGAKPAGYRIASRTDTVAGFDTLIDQIGCPAKTSVIEGGIKLGQPEGGLAFADDLDDSNTFWDGNVVNQGNVSHAVTLYAICAA